MFPSGTCAWSQSPDARGPVGLDEAIRRANLYAEAGADMLFPDALLSEDEFARFAATVRALKMMNIWAAIR